eukprot:gene5763-9016_t
MEASKWQSFSVILIVAVAGLILVLVRLPKNNHEFPAQSLHSIQNSVTSDPQLQIRNQKFPSFDNKWLHAKNETQTAIESSTHANRFNKREFSKRIHVGSGETKFFVQEKDLIDTPETLSRLFHQSCKFNWSYVINLQLKNWETTGITLEQVDRLCIRKAIRISVQNKEIRYTSWNLSNQHLHRVTCALWLIQIAALRASANGNPLPPLEFMMQPGDGTFSTAPASLHWKEAGPLFSNAKCGHDASVSFPATAHDQFGLGSGEMSISLWEQREALLHAIDVSDWKNKQPQLFFSAGEGASLRGYRANIFSINSSHVAAIPSSRPVHEWGKYQYLLYAYGHHGWSRRLHELAQINAVVLMEESNCREYLHHAFEEGVDYISVAEDFSDVKQAMEALIKVPETSRRMAGRWGHKGRQITSLPCTIQFVEDLLRKYADLQRFVPPQRPDWALYKLGDGIHQLNANKNRADPNL